MATPDQIQAAIQRAQAAGDKEAVADLQERLQSAQNPGAGPTPTGGGASAQDNGYTFRRSGIQALGAPGSGMADAGIKGYLGLKQFFGGLSDDERKVLKQMAEEAEHDPNSGARNTAEFGTNVVTALLPGVGALGKVGNLFKGAGLATRGAVSAGVQNAALTPTEGDTFLEQMGNKVIEGGKGALLGGAIGALAKPVTGLFKATDEARRLFMQGINPTLQQGAAGFPGKIIGGLTAGAARVRQRQSDEIANAWLKKTTEGKVQLPEGTGAEFLDAADGYVDDAFTKLWDGKRVNLSPSIRKSVAASVSSLPKDGRGAEEAAEASKILANRLGESAANQRLSMSNFRKEYRKPLTDAAYAQQGEVRDRLLRVRQELDDLVMKPALSKAEQARLQELNRLQFDLSRGEEAVKGAKLAGEGMDIRALAKAYGAKRAQGESIGSTTYDDLVAPAMRMIDNTPTQHSIRAGLAGVAKAGVPAAGVAAMAGAGPGAVALGIPYALSLAGQTAQGSKVLLGQTEKQKMIAELLRRQAVAQGLGGATVAMNPEQGDF